MNKNRFFAMVMLAVLLLSLSVSAVDYPDRRFEKDYALYFETAPVFDGVISAEEWGEPTLVLIDDGSIPSSFSMRVNDTGILADPSIVPDEQCSIWLRWDETYFYVGVTHPDIAPFHQYADGSGEFWNGDVIQFGTDFGGNFELQNLEPAASWGAEYRLHLFAECSNDNQDYAFSYNYTDYSKLKYNINNNGATTTYETAIPWEGYITDDPVGIEDGKIIGFALTILFADDSSDYYGWLGWGDNICYNQLDESRVGNNQIKLSSAPAVTIPEVTEEPADIAAAALPEKIDEAPQTADTAPVILLALALSAIYLTRRNKRI